MGELHAYASGRNDSPRTRIRLIDNGSGRHSYQGDFRHLRHVGGRRLILMEPGSRMPVRCRDRADALYRATEEALVASRERVGILKLQFDPTLGPTARAYLIAKAKGGNHAIGTLEIEGRALTRFVTYFNNPRLSAITGVALEQYCRTRLLVPGNSRGSTISPRTVRNELYALSGMFEQARRWKLVHHNVVADISNKPLARSASEAVWLTSEQAARLLDAAVRLGTITRWAKCIVITWRDERARGCAGCQPPRWAYAAARRYAHCEALLATFLYTGGRLKEVLGLEVKDVLFEDKRVWFRPNRYRTLKRTHHKRRVELWRPLADTLKHHIATLENKAGLLFPGLDGKMTQAITSPFMRCVREAGLESDLAVVGRRLTRHSLRHTYATRLLRTVVRSEDGTRVERSAYSVARHLGHRTSYLVETVYAHDLDGTPLTNRLSYEQNRLHRASRLRR
jgi:integrase